MLTILECFFQSILQVVLISLSGWFLAKKNILDKKILKVITSSIGKRDADESPTAIE